MDLFYDGSQDVPLPFEDGAGKMGRFRPSADPSFCESCNASVSPEELARGSATEVYGLTLCKSCRGSERAEERVELYFCDRCHVSVPVYKVDTGEALAGDGRILCLNCRETRERSRTVRFAALAVALLISFTAGATWVSQLRHPSRSGSSAAAESVGDPTVPVAVAPIEGSWGLGQRISTVSEHLTQAVEGMDELESARVDLSEKHAIALGILRDARSDFALRMELLESEAGALRRELRRALERPIPER